MNEDKPGWHKDEPVERFYVNYEPKNNPPTHEAILPNHGEKELKSSTIAVCVTNDSNKNLTTSQKDLL